MSFETQYFPVIKYCFDYDSMKFAYIIRNWALQFNFHVDSWIPSTKNTDKHGKSDVIQIIIAQ